MAHYKYKVTIAGGKVKEGRVTAKDEATARKTVAAQQSVIDWISIVKIPAVIASPSSTPTPPAVKTKASVTKPPFGKLQKMLFLQHGKCFFCGKPLPEIEASIEHLNPLSLGGTRTEDNEVVCHKSLNSAFGDLDLKRKFSYALLNAGKFECP